MRVKAGTLFFVLLISLLITILMTSLILFAFYTRQKNNDDLAFLKLQMNVESTFNYLSSGCMVAEHDTTYQIDLYGEEEDSVMISLQPWGIFQVASITAHHQARTVNKSCFMGYLPPDSNTALCLTNKKRDFTISGDARIFGNAILPTQYVNRGNAEGKHYSGDKLIYDGRIKTTESISLPAPDNHLLANVKLKLLTLKEQLHKAIFIDRDTVEYKRSFHEPTTYLKPHGYRLPEGLVLTGNIILCSDTLIRISSTCKLNDIIIIAPSVVFEEDFEGAVQVFCKDSILTGDDCRFTYPSVFGLFKTEFSFRMPYIKTGENNRLEALVFSLHEVQDLNGSRISLGNTNHYTGILYTQGELELKPGTTVEGSILASELILKTNSSQYSNNLLDVVINSLQLPGFFAGTILPSPTSRLSIVKWLSQ